MKHIQFGRKPNLRQPSIRSPGLNTISEQKVTRNASKNDLLAKYQEKSEFMDEDSNIIMDFGNPNPEGGLNLEDEFATLQIKDGDVDLPTLKRSGSSYNHKKGEYNTIQGKDLPGGFGEESDVSNLQAWLKKKGLGAYDDDLKVSPATISTSSPKRSKSLSEYSEDTNDTDITSQFNEEDFEGIDDIFGNEESGIYSSGGSGNANGGNKNVNRAKERLQMNKKKLSERAEMEEKELYQKFRNPNHEEVQTLKLKDFHNLEREQVDIDALDNDRTVNYEYTKDDFENFEDGFDLGSPIKFDAGKLKQFTGKQRKGEILPKKSMPTFTSQNRERLLSSKKFRSSIDFNVNEARNQEHPVFNNNNRIIRKLDRIPSFYVKENEKISRTDALNEDMEAKKQQLLSKYMEITEKQNKLNKRKSKVFDAQPKAKNKKVGLIRYLNEEPITVLNNKHMKYNPKSKNWEGNDIDLVKFETLPASKPSLIPYEDFNTNTQGVKIQGNMVYDPDSLKWVNLNREEEEDIFQDVPDLQTDKRYLSTGPGKLGNRGASTFTQRTESTSSSHSDSTSVNEFYLPSKLIDRFHKEEMKYHRKLSYWFQKNETYDLLNDYHNKNYYWEIRKMVIDNEE
ncbi:Piso0_001505 [Millerozyma farinosa CBS 7064]|uniref:Piso0_001505 protein n=1 Tax=Pichia sorbitophila (strain ATCC MYA-4447 / BCRC 22081 / CBS 7064 / NBRC 10061 / NRRL Y-12695) TaxID=559304 RepID=G8YKZ3_PICSO|nr:Piso0_001505 [Millerozyma farinosa CBS 7064]